MLWKIGFLAAAMLVLILVLILFFVIPKAKEVEDNRKEIAEQKYRENIEKLSQDYNNKIEQLNDQYQQKLQIYSQKQIELSTNYNQMETELRAHHEQLDRNLSQMQRSKFLAATQKSQEAREQLYKEIQDYGAAAKQQIQNEIVELRDSKIDLEENIEDLKYIRDTLIEAKRKEEEVKLQQDFYKIHLSQIELNDISLLKSIESKLTNKDPLYKLIWQTFYMAPTKQLLNNIIGKDKTSGIYKITNQINGKVYVGQSVDLHTRITNHIKASIGISTIAHQTVHDAMNEFGLENFTFEILDKCEKWQLNDREKLWIETYASDKYGYNCTAGGARKEED